MYDSTVSQGFRKRWRFDVMVTLCQDKLNALSSFKDCSLQQNIYKDLSFPIFYIITFKLENILLGPGLENGVPWGKNIFFFWGGGGMPLFIWRNVLRFVINAL